MIQPAVLLNMHSYFLLHPTLTSLHLLPPHEHLSSRLRTVYDEDKGISASFAWLGHGTFLRRATVIEFMDLLQKLNITEDERQMADNYFTILANKVPEIWFDHGIELGGGEPFTSGIDGHARNERHISRAMEYLRTLVDARKSQLMPYISEADDPPEFVVNFSPSRHHPGIISSNIDLLPRNLPIPSIETNNIAQTSFVGDAVLQAYIDHPLSNAVDSDSNTFFISPDGVTVGEWLIYDSLGALEGNSTVELVFLVEDEGADALPSCEFSRSLDAQIWEVVNTPIICNMTILQSGRGGSLFECYARMVNIEDNVTFRAFKVTFREIGRAHV